MKLDYHWYANRWVLGLLLIASVMLLIGALLSPKINNVHRWLVLGPFRAQPSELAKLVMVLFTASFVASRKDALNEGKRALLFYFLVLGTILGLVFAEPDLGTTACIAFTSILLLYLAGLRYRYILLILVGAAVSFCLMIFRFPYQLERILAFLNPEKDPLGINYQINHSLIAFGSGGWTGLGLGQGEQKLGYLPETHTDFIFAIVGEEAGLLGAACVLTLFLLLFRRGVKVSLRANSSLGTFLGLGIVGMIVIQALVNMSVVVSLLPTKGIPLPFISVGGSSLLATLAGIGILLNISSQPGDPADKPWYRKAA
jgi:cell division protein FtsW